MSSCCSPYLENGSELVVILASGVDGFSKFFFKKMFHLFAEKKQTIRGTSSKRIFKKKFLLRCLTNFWIALSLDFGVYCYVGVFISTGYEGKEMSIMSILVLPES